MFGGVWSGYVGFDLVMYGEDSGLVRSGLVMSVEVEFGKVLFDMARFGEVWHIII